MLLFFYVSGHGFGHAARATQVVNALARLEPAVRVVIRASVPEWFLRASLQTPAEISPCETDTGVVQHDGLSIDEDETARRAAVFHAGFDANVERERRILVDRGATIVVGDIPPLAFAAAHAAGVPSVAISNFTWDWIYAGFPGFDRLAPGVRQQIADANALATLALRLPFHGGFQSMRRVEDVPLVARHAAASRDDTRRRLQLSDARPVVLATFGGHRGTIPLGRAADSASFLLVATNYEVAHDAPVHSNLRVVTADELTRTGLSYTDLLAACDVVVTKLGYGIVSECIANNVALLYSPRGRFVEQDVFMREMPAVLRCRMIDQDDLRNGRWADSIKALVAQSVPASSMATDGAAVAAGKILELELTQRGSLDPTGCGRVGPASAKASAVRRSFSESGSPLRKSVLTSVVSSS